MAKVCRSDQRALNFPLAGACSSSTITVIIIAKIASVKASILCLGKVVLPFLTNPVYTKAARSGGLMLASDCLNDC